MPNRPKTVTPERLEYAREHGIEAASEKFGISPRSLRNGLTKKYGNSDEDEEDDDTSSYDPESGKRVLARIGFSSREEVLKELEDYYQKG